MLHVVADNINFLFRRFNNMKYSNAFRHGVTLVVSFFLLMSVQLGFALPEGQGGPSLPQKENVQPSLSSPVNLNTADLGTLVNARIKGIGKKRAQAIITYRTQHGPFKSVDELKNIKGISEKVINANRDKLKV